MVDPYDEEMRKRALSEWSSSRYAKLERDLGLTPILLPQNHPEREFSGGVGTPYVVQHPENPSKHTMLFTGWGPDIERSLFAADIDPRTFELSDFRKLATRDDFPNLDNINAVHALWDTPNDNWITTHTGTSTVSGENNRVGAARFDKDFTSLIETADYLPFSTVTDSGAPLVPRYLNSNKAILTAAQGPPPRTLKLVTVDDYTALPGGGATLTAEQDIWKSGTRGGQGPDVHHTFVMNHSIVIVAETMNDSHWNLKVGIAPVEESDDWTDIRIPATNSTFLGNNFTTGHPHTGHPHYSTLFGRPVLFHAWFRKLSAASGQTLRHEIWAQCLRGDELRPSSLAPRSAWGPVDANASSPWMPTYGRPVNVYWDAGEAGDVNIDLAADLYEARQGNYHTETKSPAGAETDYFKFTEGNLEWVRVRTANFATPTVKTKVTFR